MVRQELVFCVLDTVPSNEVVSFLISFSEFILAKHEALLRGSVIGPADTIFSGSPMNAVYASIPVIFDDEFATYEGSSPSAVMARLIPILNVKRSIFKRAGGKHSKTFLSSKISIYGISIEIL